MTVLFVRNAYEAETGRGVSETVLSRGKVIVDHGKFLGKAGSGRYLRRDARK